MVGVDPRSLTRPLLDDLYKNYYQRSLVGFLERVRFFCCTKNVFDYLVAYGEDWHDLLVFVEFLESERILSLKGFGKPVVRKKEFLRLFPSILSADEIARRIERKIRARTNPNASVAELIQRFVPVRVQGQWDQMPLSQDSALRVLEKIVQTMPLAGPVLFVGDDDYLSVMLALACPEMRLTVADADSALLSNIAALAKRFHLNITTQYVDLAKPEKISGQFFGFVCNPMYTESGVKLFVDFGLRHLGSDGGFAFVQIGDEAIGNRILFLQEYFAKNRLIIRDMLAGKLFYPFRALHAEDEMTVPQLQRIAGRKNISAIPRLGETLYTLEYLPFALQRVANKLPFYAYL